MRAEIVLASRNENGLIATTTKNTDLSQRDTLEEVIVNLASVLGVQQVLKTQSARGSYYYKVPMSGASVFQSASNTILELSRVLAHVK